MMEYYPVMAHQEVQLHMLVSNNRQDIIKYKQQGHEQNVLNCLSRMHILKGYAQLYLMVNTCDVLEKSKYIFKGDVFWRDFWE